MTPTIRERSYPGHLYKNEGPFSEEQLSRLGASRVAVAGLGAFGLGAVGLAQLGIGCGPGGWLRIADPDVFESHNANRQALAGGRLGSNKTEVTADLIRGLVPSLNLQTFSEGVTTENLEDFLRDAELVIDMVDYLRPEVKRELHRRCRAAGIPVVAGMLVERGAIAYVFAPESPVSFEEFFAIPEDPTLARSWWLPVSRIVVLPHPPERQRLYFDVLNGRHPIPSNCLSATATHLLLNHLAVNLLLGQPVPTIPRVACLDPGSWTLGELDLGPSVSAQQSSPWTALAPHYDDVMEGPCEGLFARIGRDLAGCRQVLEAGCGTGLLCERLASAGHEVVGLDSNLAMLARAAGRARRAGFQLGEGDVEKLFFADGSFDGYVSVNVVLQTDLQSTLREAYRVLRSGGLLALSSFTAQPDLSAVPAEFADLARAIHAGSRYPALSEVVAAVEAAGFEPLVTDRGFLAESYYLLARR